MIVNERLVTYLDSLTWQIPEPMQELEQWALQKEVPIIRRSMQSLLLFMLRLRQPKHVLEIGTAVGFSALLMRSELLPDATLDTIEKVPARICDAKENFAKSPQGDKIRLLEGDAADVLKTLNEPFDLIFMDAAKGQYIHFMPDILRLLKTGGTLVSDNVLQDGDIIESHYAVTRRNRTIYKRMREYLYELTHREDLVTAVLPVGDGITVSTKVEENDSVEEERQDKDERD